MEQQENTQNDDCDFEIRFFESIVKEKPNFIEALAALGDLYTKKGYCKEGLKVDLRLSTLRPDDPIILYNLACSYSLLEDIDRALEVIKQAIACGYDDFNHLAKDDDLKNLREDKRFKKLILKQKDGISQ